MGSNSNIIIVESDSTSFAVDMKKMLNSIGFESCRIANYTQSIEELRALNPELVILDPSLDTETSLKCIHKFKILNPSITILTSSDDCLPNGPCFAPFEGVHFLVPNPDHDSIARTIETSLRHKTDSELLPDSPFIIGQSPGITSVREKIRKIANKDVTVLITGETGTGKELVARSIHLHSLRRKEPLIKVDCTSLPDELLESEIFGFQKGAFTDAYTDKPGRLELADGGTLFIDEIGDLSLSLQVKLLQIFEDREFSRLGGTEDKLIDVRIVAATNSDLWKKVKEGNFREDIYYRINIMQIEVPPLRDRKEDIPWLIYYFLNKYCFEFKKKLIAVPAKVSDFFMAYHWPGNIRELENVLRRAIAVSDWDFIFEELRPENTNFKEEAEKDSSPDPSHLKLNDDELVTLLQENDFSLKKLSKSYVGDAERHAIQNALQNTQWNRAKAARLLGVSYRTLTKRIDKLNLKP